MKPVTDSHRPVFVSFSGIDGAGKSTQIRNLCSFLNQAGQRVCVLAFWDHLAFSSRIREWMSLHLFKGDKGAGTPEKPVKRRDKNVQSPYLNAVRCLIYFCDALRANFLLARFRKTDSDVVILDRYLYDELANLPSTGRMWRAYSTLVAKLCPRPEVRFLLDADPEQARRRKPEYPLEFLKRNRAVYLNLSRWFDLVVIPEMSEPEVSAWITQVLVERTRSEIAWGPAALPDRQGRSAGCVRPVS